MYFFKLEELPQVMLIEAKNGVKFRGSASILQRAKTQAPRFIWLHPNKLVSQT